MAVIVLNNENFENEVMKSTKPVLIDFFATWCGPCRRVSPIVDEIAEEYDSFTICKVDVDEEPELAEKYNVMNIPTLVVIKNGAIVSKGVGAKTKEELLEMLNS